MPEQLELGTRAELAIVHERVFGRPAPEQTPLLPLRKSILTAVSPLRLDWEVNRLRGKAINQEQKP